MQIKTCVNVVNNDEHSDLSQIINPSRIIRQSLGLSVKDYITYIALFLYVTYSGTFCTCCTFQGLSVTRYVCTFHGTSRRRTLSEGFASVSGFPSEPRKVLDFSQAHRGASRRGEAARSAALRYNVTLPRRNGDAQSVTRRSLTLGRHCRYSNASGLYSYSYKDITRL